MQPTLNFKRVTESRVIQDGKVETTERMFMLQNGIVSGDAKRYMTKHRLNCGVLLPFFH